VSTASMMDLLSYWLMPEGQMQLALNQICQMFGLTCTII
jgi:hypothetical protein